MLRKKKVKRYMTEALTFAKDCGKVVLEGLAHYGDAIRDSFNPFPTEDAPIIMLALRAIADSMENTAPNTKGMYETLRKTVQVGDIEISTKPTKRRNLR